MWDGRVSAVKATLSTCLAPREAVTKPSLQASFVGIFEEMLGFRMAFLFPMVASHADHLMSFNVGRSALCILYIIYMHTGCRLHVQNQGFNHDFLRPKRYIMVVWGQESSHSKCQLWCFRFSGYDCDNDHATRSLSDIRSHLSLPLSMSLLL